MSGEEKTFLFGPVPSRRLGMSLGVDLVPRKTCSMDCVYCESGKTTNLTVERREYHPTAAIIAELDAYLADKPELDHITFSGAGEPTLHSGIGEIIAFLKNKHSEYKICLLTNAMLLPLNEKLFEELKPLDLIVPSLDSVAPAKFAEINRPASPVELESLVDALARFKKESDALMHLEIFIVKGVNDSNEDAAEFAAAVQRIRPDKVQINSLDRPGTENWVEPADAAFLLALRDSLAKFAETEVVAKFAAAGSGARRALPPDARKRVLDMVARRPCTAEDMATSLGCGTAEVERLLSEMRAEGVLISEKRGRGLFHKPA